MYETCCIPGYRVTNKGRGYHLRKESELSVRGTSMYR
jgi:hypothetical protein